MSPMKPGRVSVCRGPIVSKTMGNSSFFLTPNGEKQIVIGYSCNEQFTPIIKFYNYATVQNMVALKPCEWSELTRWDKDIDAYFEGDSDFGETRYLGTVSRFLKFGRILGRKSLVLCQKNSSHRKCPREIALQEKAWKELKKLAPSISAVVIKAEDNQQKFQKLFSETCDLVLRKCQYLDNASISNFVNALDSDSFDVKTFPMMISPYTLCELKNQCRHLIVRKVMSIKHGFNLSHHDLDGS